jgi:hypothetical protein
MMNCHLIKAAKTRTLTPVKVKSDTDRVEVILESDSFDVRIVKFQECGQLYLFCFKQYTSPDGEDDYWTFWIPIEESEIGVIKSGNPIQKVIGEMVEKRPHICWHPDGHIFWAAKGFPMAFFAFLQ